jgi:DNA repair photolyase
METIERKSLLNKSALGFLCVNHVQGCSHGCLYPCYAFSMARSYGRARDYEDWCSPRLVSNARELLAKELGRLKKRREAAPSRVHFCLTTDPFMFGWPEIAASSLELIGMINAAGIPVSVLTKGILPEALADTRAFPCGNSYGISLVSLSEEFRREWEPGASPYVERIAALRRLHEAGRSTYVHIEPYPTPNAYRPSANLSAQDLGELLEAAGFVDSLYFGGWNYNAATKNFPDREGFYETCAAKAKRFCRERGIDFAGGA